MLSASGFRHLLTLFGATLIAALVLGPSAQARSGSPEDGALSPLLAELADSPAVVETRPEALNAVPEGPGSLLEEGSRILVSVRFEQGAAAAIDELQAAGAQIVDASPRYQTVTVAARPAELSALADVPRVAGVTEILEPLVSAASVCFGATTSEGDLQLGAMAARDGFEIDGAGVTVGVISDSFDTDSEAPKYAAEDVVSGDLPGPGNPCSRNKAVNRLDDSYVKTESTDEGRAMAQIVHDLAPGAGLAFATAFQGETDFAENIGHLAEPISSGGAGADVIVDDVSYFEEPFFQDGPVAVAVREASEDGVPYFSSAGNNNLIDAEGNNIASWEAPEFRDAPSCPDALEVAVEAEKCMDFKPGAGADPTFEVTVSKGATLLIDLQWSEPWNGVTTDLDAFLLDVEDKPLEGETGKGSIVESAKDNIQKTQRPVEIVRWVNKTGAVQKVRLAINRCFGLGCNAFASPTAKPRLKFVLLQNGGGVSATEYPKSSGGDVVGPTIFGHNGTEEAVSVGAIRYSSTSSPERFSSRGPVTHYFGPVVGAVPAAALGAPAVLAKPDITATDGGANTYFGSCASNVWRFFGTSAAAPHAAAIAALQLDAAPAPLPSATRAEAVKEAQIDSAEPIGAFAATAVGAGLLQAPEAVALLSSPFPGGVAFAQLLQPNCDLPSDPDDPNLPLPTNPQPPLVTKDQVAPHTSFLRKPPKRIRTHRRRAKAIFVLQSSESGSTFVCRADGDPYRPCLPRLVWRFSARSHAMRVKAVDANGNADPTPALYRFRVVRIGQ